MKNKFLLFFVPLAVLAARPALAVCPVCVVAVGAGLGLSRFLGIDDTISGLWIGALLLALVFWTIDWMGRKHIKFKGDQVVVFVAYYGLVVAPLYWNEIIGHPLNKFWGVDKLVLGIFFGSLVFWGGAALYPYLKKKNGGKAHFPFQKVAMPIIPVVVLSILFYFLTK
ncbi:MAG: hypothetical protein WCP18_03685 [bacterium]